jgi:hypothetical protein
VPLKSPGTAKGMVAFAATGFIIGSKQHFTAAFLLAASKNMLGVIGWWWTLPKLKELPWDAEVPAAGQLATV